MDRMFVFFFQSKRRKRDLIRVRWAGKGVKRQLMSQSKALQASVNHPFLHTARVCGQMCKFADHAGPKQPPNAVDNTRHCSRGIFQISPEERARDARATVGKQVENVGKPKVSPGYNLHMLAVKGRLPLGNHVDPVGHSMGIHICVRSHVC